MSDAQIITPNDLLIETIAALLVKVGGYKDAAEAVRQATKMIEAIGGKDGDFDESIALTEFQNLVIQAAGATNYIEQQTQDDADQTVRFVSEDGAAPQHVEETPVEAQADSMTTLKGVLGEMLGVDPDQLVLVPAGQRFGGAGFPLN